MRKCPATDLNGAARHLGRLPIAPVLLMTGHPITGGTGLPSQRECLEMMDCYGQGKARKLAEIIGATVLAGEMSLAAAVATGDWVTSHEQYGRNR